MFIQPVYLFLFSISDFQACLSIVAYYEKFSNCAPSFRAGLINTQTAALSRDPHVHHTTRAHTIKPLIRGCWVSNFRARQAIIWFQTRHLIGAFLLIRPVMIAIQVRGQNVSGLSEVNFSRSILENVRSRANDVTEVIAPILLDRMNIYSSLMVLGPNFGFIE